MPVTFRPKYSDTHSDIILHDSSFRDSVIKRPSPFSLPSQITTVKPAFHYITKAPKSTNLVSSTEHVDSTHENFSSLNLTNFINQHEVSTIHRNRIIVPTTYSPPKFFLKSILKKPVSHTTPIVRHTDISDAQFHSTADNVLRRPENSQKFYKTLKAVRKLINPVTLNHELSATTGASYASAEQLVSDINDEPTNLQDYHESNFEKSSFVSIEPKALDSRVSPTTVRFSSIKPVTMKMKTTTTSTPSTSLKTTTTVKIPPSTFSTHITRKYFNDDYVSERLRSRFENEKMKHYVEQDQSNFTAPVKKRFRTTVEIPPALELLDSDDKQKPEPDQPPVYKPKPFPKPIMSTATKTDIPQNTSLPTRASRINAAIKTLIANGGTRRPNSKCNENQSPNTKCNSDPKQRYLFLI